MQQMLHTLAKVHCNCPSDQLSLSTGDHGCLCLTKRHCAYNERLEAFTFGEARQKVTADDCGYDNKNMNQKQR